MTKTTPTTKKTTAVAEPKSKAATAVAKPKSKAATAAAKPKSKAATAQQTSNLPAPSLNPDQARKDIAAMFAQAAKAGSAKAG